MIEGMDQITTKMHELKTWPEYFQATLEGRKPFEIRKNDRNFKGGDDLLLREFDPKEQKYTGRAIVGRVTYVTDFAQTEGMVVFGVIPIRSI